MGDEPVAEPTVCLPPLCRRAEECKPPVRPPVRRPDKREANRVVAPEPTARTASFFFAIVELFIGGGGVAGGACYSRYVSTYRNK